MPRTSDWLVTYEIYANSLPIDSDTMHFSVDEKEDVKAYSQGRLTDFYTMKHPNQKIEVKISAINEMRG